MHVCAHTDVYEYVVLRLHMYMGYVICKDERENVVNGKRVRYDLQCGNAGLWVSLIAINEGREFQ